MFICDLLKEADFEQLKALDTGLFNSSYLKDHNILLSDAILWIKALSKLLNPR